MENGETQNRKTGTPKSRSWRGEESSANKRSSIAKGPSDIEVASRYANEIAGRGGPLTIRRGGPAGGCER